MLHKIKRYLSSPESRPLNLELKRKMVDPIHTPRVTFPQIGCRESHYYDKIAGVEGFKLGQTLLLVEATFQLNRTLLTEQHLFSSVKQNLRDKSQGWV